MEPGRMGMGDSANPSGGGGNHPGAAAEVAVGHHYWPLPLPLGCMATDSEGRHAGRIVAVFVNYKAAVKWGAWDLTHTSPDECPEEPYYLIHTSAGALLVGSRHTHPHPDATGQLPNIDAAAVHALTHKIIHPPIPVAAVTVDDAVLQYEREQVRERQRRRRRRLARGVR